MLKELTKNYVEAFNSRDIKKVEEFFLNDFALEDPIVKRIEGKEKVLVVIEVIFNSCTDLSFEAKNIYQDNQITIIEFILRLDDITLVGTDIIEWKDDKMKELRAYLDIPCSDN